MTACAPPERGIAVARPLAWTILASLIGAALWTGQQSQQIAHQRERLAAAETRIGALEARMSAGELERAVSGQQVAEILRLVERIDERVARMERAGAPPTTGR